MSALTDFRAAMQLISPKVSKHLKPVAKEDLETKTLYHVSLDHSIPVFIPQVSARTVTDEDVRVPRICTATNLLGCLVGYSAMWGDYYNKQNKEGWAVYEFDFDLAVRPTETLLPDREETGEYWLITYNRETREYRPKIQGNIWLAAYASQKFKSGWRYSLGFVVECKAPLWITNELCLEAGKHYVTVEDWRSVVDLERLVVNARVLDDKTYEQLLAGRLNLLPQLTPGSSQW